MKKKVILVLTALVLFLSVLNVPRINAAEITRESKKVISTQITNQSIAIGKDFLNNYYSTIVKEKKMNLERYSIDGKVTSYIEKKHNIMVNRRKSTGIEVVKQSVKVKCLESKREGNKVDIVYAVVDTRYIKGNSIPSETGCSVRLTVVNENGKLTIKDYFELDFFDIGNATVISNSNSKNGSDKIMSYKIDFNKSKELNKKLNSVLKSENAFYSRLKNNVSNNGLNSKSTAGISSISSTERSKIVTYALANCTKTSPSSGNSSYAPYYDFSSISGAYDCTNFASHCMLAGGAKENRSTWYYDGLGSGKRTSSWSGVDEFFNFAVKNSGNGPQGDKKSLTYNCPSASINSKTGDIVQIQYSGYGYPGFGHTTVITSYYSYNQYRVVPSITSRTGDNWYNKNAILTEYYPIGGDTLAYRLLYITDLV